VVIDDVVDPVAADICIIDGRAQLDAGNVVVYSRSDLIEDLVLGDYWCSRPYQLDAAKGNIGGRVRAADGVVIDVQSFVNAIEQGGVAHGDAFIGRVDLVVLNGEEIIVVPVRADRESAASENAENTGGAA
jgi:hypothetical protein